MCSNSTPLTSECLEYGDMWVQCTSEGHDHTRCCAESGDSFKLNFDFLIFTFASFVFIMKSFAGIPDGCMSACRHPFTFKKNCIEYTPTLAKCYSWLTTNLPSAIANLEVTSRNSSSVLLSWDIPLQRPADFYQVTLDKGTSVFRQVRF